MTIIIGMAALVAAGIAYLFLSLGKYDPNEFHD